MLETIHERTLRDEDVLRYVLDKDDLSRESKAHLQECDICQDRVARYRHVNTALLARLYRQQCPRATSLSAYCSGMLPADTAVHISSHLQICPLCAADVREMQRLLFIPVWED